MTFSYPVQPLLKQTKQTYSIAVVNGTSNQVKKKMFDFCDYLFKGKVVMEVVSLRACFVNMCSVTKWFSEVAVIQPLRLTWP